MRFTQQLQHWAHNANIQRVVVVAGMLLYAVAPVPE